MPAAAFDLQAYLRRIGLDRPPSPDIAGLRAIVAHHTAAIPFENLDIIFGRPIRLDLPSLQAKLIQAGRGGYCFEQNTLLRAALEHLGFTVESLMARVVRTAATPDAITPRTHMFLRVTLPEGAFLADVGFGNLTPTAPLRLAGTAPQPTPHETYRLQPLNAETLLQARIGEDWAAIYRFPADPTHPIDHEVGNWFTATRPGGLFTSNVIAARPAAGIRATLINGQLTIRHAAQAPVRQTITTAAALAEALRSHFGIHLSDPECATLHAAAQNFAARAEPGPRFE